MFPHIWFIGCSRELSDPMSWISILQFVLSGTTLDPGKKEIDFARQKRSCAAVLLFFLVYVVHAAAGLPITHTGLSSHYTLFLAQLASPWFGDHLPNEANPRQTAISLNFHPNTQYGISVVARGVQSFEAGILSLG